MLPSCEELQGLIASFGFSGNVTINGGMNKALNQIISAGDFWKSAREPEWPQQCACCNQANETTISIEFEEYDDDGRIVYQRAWQVPYCLVCARHVQSALSLNAKTLLAPAPSLGLLLAIVISWIFCSIYDSSLPFVFTVALICLLVAFYKWRGIQRAKRGLRSCCSVVGPAVVCLSRHQFKGEMHTFSFKNKVYATAFERCNHTK